MYVIYKGVDQNDDFGEGNDAIESLEILQIFT